MTLPFLITFIVLVIGISTGLMQNVSVSTDPEEVLIRGLILNELRK
ncbi:hypothetical protein HI031_01240 [Staphylococcus haemolyticus]|nr:hypothetical protein HI031_01240 [Staphylococcus haemolyticus]